MSAISSPLPTAPGSGVVPTDEVDASCRVPLFVLFVSAAVWALIASVLALIASIKFHQPEFLADCPWLTYGRIHAAAGNARIYGFALQAGFGVALWLIARLGGNRVGQPWLIAIGGKVWNLGVLVGVIAILAGDSTGFENLEMPRYAAVILFAGFLMIGLWTLFTFHNRNERRLSPPQWFLVAALFWFPWIYSTAGLLLLVCPVRGVTQALIAWWFSNNLVFVELGLVGLAGIYYFIPHFFGRPLYSECLARFTFWTLILFASWCGIPNSAPLPAWMPVLSCVATVLTLVIFISIGLNILHTKSGVSMKTIAGCIPWFFFFGLGMFQLSGLVRIIAALPPVSAVVHFTWFTVAQSQLYANGYFAMILFGAIYYIVPRVTGLEWPMPKAVGWHFRCAVAGVVLLVLPLAVGGILQGMKLSAQVEFMQLAKETLPFLRISTLGDLLLLVGQFLLAANIISLSIRYYRTHFLPVYQEATAELKPAEARP
jgi:cytochrome c oxidase cbb3-type subunit 1